MSDFFDDALGFDPNGHGIHDTFIGDIMDNPIVNTVMKFTPLAPVAYGWNAASAMGGGNIAGAALNAMGAYGSLPGGSPAGEAWSNATTGSKIGRAHV